MVRLRTVLCLHQFLPSLLELVLTRRRSLRQGEMNPDARMLGVCKERRWGITSTVGRQGFLSAASRWLLKYSLKV